MTALFSAPVAATYGSDDQAAPLVVLLHGRGSNEQDILGLASHLPTGPAYAAVRAPIGEGGGYAWFANRGIGRPVAASLRDTMDWFRAGSTRPRIRDDPSSLPGSAAAPRSPAAWCWTTRPATPGPRSSTAPCPSMPASPPTRAGSPTSPSSWPKETATTSSRESFSTAPGATCCPSPAHPPWRGDSPAATRSPPRPPTTSATGSPTGSASSTTTARSRLDPLKTSAGPRCPAASYRTAGPGPEVSWTIPQQQQTQNAPAELQEQLFDAIRQLPGVDVGPSHISVPGARGFTLSEGSADEQAFLVPQFAEFAHLHPPYDGSLHLILPPALPADVSAKGWGRPHMWAGTRLSPGFTLIHGPRDDAELATVRGIVAASHAYATGTFPVAS